MRDPRTMPQSDLAIVVDLIRLILYLDDRGEAADHISWDEGKARMIDGLIREFGLVPGRGRPDDDRVIVRAQAVFGDAGEPSSMPVGGP